jgi:hypothetical protein
MKRPLLLDLFAGAGGAARGYQRAGFHVLGVDINPQPDYCGDDFVQADVLEMLHLLTLADARHASPPCQRYTSLAAGNNANAEQYPDLVATVREALMASGKPYVIENVPNAPLRNPITLCGEMFGLDVIRHRAFESNVLLMQPEHLPHRGRVAGYRHGEWFEGPYFAVYGDGGGKGTVAQWQSAMGIDWTENRKSIAEAIPPAYTEFIGAQLMQAIEVAA